MKLPPGYSHPPGFPHRVFRLRRALYGLKQAPRAWFAKFSSTISQHGFSGSSFDTALFLRRSSHGITIMIECSCFKIMLEVCEGTTLGEEVI